MEKINFNRNCKSLYKDLSISLPKACWENDVDAIRRGLEKGFAVNSCDWYNNTLLHVSARFGCTEIVSLLLENRADPNLQEKDGNTPLHVSARLGCTEIVSLLLENRADLNLRDKSGNTPLHLSSKHGHTEIVSLLLAKVANTNAKNNKGFTPLHLSVQFGHKKIVSMLVANMARVNVKDQCGNTPLHYSAAGGHKEIVSMLLSKNADANVQDEDGRTPLHWSVWYGHTETVSLLLENKCNVNVKDNEGFTLIDYTDNKEIVNVLLQHGAVPYKQSCRPTFSRILSKNSTTTSSVKVNLTPGVEDSNDRSASTSFCQTRTIEIKDEVTNTIRKDETTINPTEIYKNADQHNILGSQTISASEHGQVLASAIAGDIQHCQVLASATAGDIRGRVSVSDIARDIQQAITNQLKDFPKISSACQHNISTSQQTGAAAVNINITVKNEINIQGTRDVKCQNAQIKKPKFVACNSPIKVVNSSIWTCTDDDEADNESDDETEK